MTLDEAIEHCEEVAREQENLCKYHRNLSAGLIDKFKYADKEEMCSNEHKQLAEWLKELKEYKKKYENT